MRSVCPSLSFSLFLCVSLPVNLSVCLLFYLSVCLCPVSQVNQMKGIPLLVNLFNSESEEVQRYATGAARNLIYENMPNKVALIEAGGIPQLSMALRQPDDELRKNITGENKHNDSAPSAHRFPSLQAWICSKNLTSLKETNEKNPETFRQSAAVRQHQLPRKQKKPVYVADL